MRCIFCKMKSDVCVSVEHIIPESLGNTEHILPRGWVCDSCNNYLARKVEKPFLDSLYGQNSRSTMAVPNKRGRIPPSVAWHAQSRIRVELFRESEGCLAIGAAPGEDEAKWIKSVLTHSNGTLCVPITDNPILDTVTARFIGKIGLEALAGRCLEIRDWNDEIVDKPELDDLRNYVRVGDFGKIWPIHIRRIYPQDFLFDNAQHGPHEVLHEWDILVTEAREYYCVVSIFGVEYAINLGGPELDGYRKWLRENCDQSPMYRMRPGKAVVTAGG